MTKLVLLTDGTGQDGSGDITNVAKLQDYLSNDDESGQYVCYSPGVGTRLRERCGRGRRTLRSCRRNIRLSGIRAWSRIIRSMTRRTRRGTSSMPRWRRRKRALCLAGGWGAIGTRICRIRLLQRWNWLGNCLIVGGTLPQAPAGGVYQEGWRNETGGLFRG